MSRFEEVKQEAQRSLQYIAVQYEAKDTVKGVFN